MPQAPQNQRQNPRRPSWTSSRSKTSHPDRTLEAAMTPVIMARVQEPITVPAASRSPIVRVLNEEVRHYHRWSTPSILVDQERIEDFYGSDVSISAGFFGTLVDHSGVFGEAEAFAARAQGADRTMFSVHGSSGSNWIVLRALALERQDALVLVARNTHHSIINALKAYGLDFRFLPAPYEPRFEAVLPPSVPQVV